VARGLSFRRGLCSLPRPPSNIAAPHRAAAAPALRLCSAARPPWLGQSATPGCLAPQQVAGQAQRCTLPAPCLLAGTQPSHRPATGALLGLLALAGRLPFSALPYPTRARAGRPSS